MAMPSVSGPRTCHDMDIMKLILGNCSDNSSAREKSTPRKHSRTNSSSSSSSSSSSRDRSKSHEKSGHSSDSFYSDSESRTESQRDRSSSTDGKSPKLRDDKKSEENQKDVVSDKEDDKRGQVSGVETKQSATSDKNKLKHGKRNKKSHQRRQKKKTEINKTESDNITHVINGTRNLSEETSEGNETKERSNSLNNSYSTSADECLKKQKKNVQKSQHLSKRAQRTLNLYPERYADPQRLAHSYQELRQILETHFFEGQDALNDELIKETKHVLRAYHGQHMGYAGVVKPPPGMPPAGRHGRRIWSAARERSSSWTQTDGMSSAKRPQSATGYYLIDTTKPDLSKRVTFVQEESAINENEAKNGHSTCTVSVQLSDTACHSAGELERGRVFKKLSRRPKSASQAAEKKRAGSRSRSPPTNQLHQAKWTRNSESSTSRSRSSHSRSPSGDRKLIDSHLENTENAQIREWLKQKNRLIRKQKREERRLQREKRKQEAEEAKKKMARHEHAEILFRKWMEQKQKEARLLKKRKRCPSQMIQKGKSAYSNETETIDLKCGEIVPNAGKSGLKDKDGIRVDGRKSAKHKDVSCDCHKEATAETSTQQVLACTCGFAESSASSVNDRKPTQRAPKNRRTNTPKLQRSSAEPKTTKGKTSDDENSEEKKRLSYEVWVKQKRSDDMERRKLEKKRQEALLDASEPEMDSIISGMAKRKMMNIRKARKPISAETGKTSAEVKTAKDEKTTEKQKLNGRAEEVAPSSGSSARFYRWVPKDGEQADSKREQRPISAQVKSTRKVAMDKSGRPASANIVSSSKQNRTPGGDACKGEGVKEAGSTSTEEDRHRHRALSPKPKLPATQAYKDVKYQRRSWDEFSDYVWDKLNEENEEKEHSGPEKEITETETKGKSRSQSMFDCGCEEKETGNEFGGTAEKQPSDKENMESRKEKPEAISDSSEKHLVTGKDLVDTETGQRLSGNDDTTADGDHLATDAEQMPKDEDHLTKDEDQGTIDRDHKGRCEGHITTGKDHKATDEDEMTADEDHGTTDEDHTTTDGDHSTTYEDHKTKDEDDKTEDEDHKTVAEDHKTMDDNDKTTGEDYRSTDEDNNSGDNVLPDIILASGTEMTDESDASAEVNEERQIFEEQCIREVVEKTIFSMTELDSNNAERSPPEAEHERAPSVLENIPEETENNIQPEDDSAKMSANDGRSVESAKREGSRINGDCNKSEELKGESMSRRGRSVAKER